MGHEPDREVPVFSMKPPWSLAIETNSINVLTNSVAGISQLALVVARTRGILLRQTDGELRLTPAW